MVSKISIDQPDLFILLNGDEAVARGAVEAGVQVAASYPGTPATEILEALAEMSHEFGIYAEWSINEKVATEVAAGAAMSGIRSMVSMKHVGLNVASDAVMTLAYMGVVGGMVIVVCDDPSIHSSQNEQDTRYFAVHASLPLLDAGSPQEAKDMTVDAFELSEKLRLPVIVRLTTRVAHGKGRVRLGSITQTDRRAEFDKNGLKWTMIPSTARRQRQILVRKMIEAKTMTEQSRFNFIEDNGKNIGVVGSGVGYYYAKSVLASDHFSWLKLGCVHPFPDDIVTKFLSNVKKIVVIEELRPFIEARIRCLEPNVLGKKELGLEEFNEFTPDIIRHSLSQLNLCEAAEKQEALELPSRSPVLCPGCPHRAFYYALNAVQKNKIVTGDIGCYTLGVLPPLKAVQACLCMGAGISLAAGMRQAGVQEPIFAVIGDSTFFHAGMPALLNLVYNDIKVCVVILDNQIVAMTGHQPTPETGIRAMGGRSKAVRIEDVVKALGVERVEVVDPYNVEATMQVLKAILNYEGPSVIIAKRPCALLVEKGSVREVTENCNSCGVCIRILGCPAIVMTSRGVEIDSTLCRGCGVCETICPHNSIRQVK